MSIKTVKTWDEIPPTLYDGDEAFSLRLLEKKYRAMESAMQTFIARRDEGSIRSTQTYNKFKEILNDNGR